MIENHKQYEVTKQALEKLNQTFVEFDLKEASRKVGQVLALAELEGLQSEIDILKEQIREYEAIQ